jgi:hypothetical protein
MEGTYGHASTSTQSAWSKEAIFACATISVMLLSSGAGLFYKYGRRESRRAWLWSSKVWNGKQCDSFFQRCRSYTQMIERCYLTTALLPMVGLSLKLFGSRNNGRIPLLYGRGVVLGVCTGFTDQADNSAFYTSQTAGSSNLYMSCYRWSNFLRF